MVLSFDFTTLNEVYNENKKNIIIKSKSLKDILKICGNTKADTIFLVVANCLIYHWL